MRRPHAGRRVQRPRDRWRAKEGQECRGPFLSRGDSGISAPSAKNSYTAGGTTNADVAGAWQCAPTSPAKRLPWLEERQESGLYRWTGFQPVYLTGKMPDPPESRIAGVHPPQGRLTSGPYVRADIRPAIMFVLLWADTQVRPYINIGASASRIGVFGEGPGEGVFEKRPPQKLLSLGSPAHFAVNSHGISSVVSDNTTAACAGIRQFSDVSSGRVPSHRIQGFR